MTQQISVETIQPDRFSVDPVSDLLESSVGEEIYITSKYVNKSRGDIYNLSATLVGDFNGAGQVEHVGNVAAGVSGEIEFSFTPIPQEHWQEKLPIPMRTLPAACAASAFHSPPPFWKRRPTT